MYTYIAKLYSYIAKLYSFIREMLETHKRKS